MRQQCHLGFVWLTWLGIPALALLIGARQGWPVGLGVLVVAVVAQIAYLRVFPRISRWLGYGSVADEPAPPESHRASPSRVILYTANVCPFCPIMRERLKQLQRELHFELVEVDVTFRPQILLAKGLRAVPVVEAEGRYLTSNATSAQLQAFLAEAAAAAVPPETG